MAGRSCPGQTWREWGQRVQLPNRHYRGLTSHYVIVEVYPTPDTDVMGCPSLVLISKGCESPGQPPWMGPNSRTDVTWYSLG